jgi:hypothetical protein
LNEWKRYCNYFGSDLPYRIARALEPYSARAPEHGAESVPLLATGAIWVLFAVVLEECKKAQLAAAFAISNTLDTPHSVPNASEVVEFLVPWIGKKATAHDAADIRLDFCAMVRALGHAPAWATADDAWVKAFKKAGGPRVLAQLIDSVKLLADSSPRNIIELGVALGCIRSLVRGVDELGPAFVREGVPTRILQCLVPDASTTLLTAVVLHAADPFCELRAACAEVIASSEPLSVLVTRLARPDKLALDAAGAARRRAAGGAHGGNAAVAADLSTDDEDELVAAATAAAFIAQATTAAAAATTTAAGGAVSSAVAGERRARLDRRRRRDVGVGRPVSQFDALCALYDRVSRVPLGTACGAVVCRRAAAARIRAAALRRAVAFGLCRHA